MPVYLSRFPNTSLFIHKLPKFPALGEGQISEKEELYLNLKTQSICQFSTKNLIERLKHWPKTKSYFCQKFETLYRVPRGTLYFSDVLFLTYMT